VQAVTQLQAEIGAPPWVLGWVAHRLLDEQRALLRVSRDTVDELWLQPLVAPLRCRQRVVPAGRAGCCDAGRSAGSATGDAAPGRAGRCRNQARKPPRGARRRPTRSRCRRRSARPGAALPYRARHRRPCTPSSRLVLSARPARPARPARLRAARGRAAAADGAVVRRTHIARRAGLQHDCAVLDHAWLRCGGLEPRRVSGYGRAYRERLRGQ